MPPDASVDDNGRSGPSWLGRGWSRPLLLLVVLVFAGGAVGYAIGVNDADPPVGEVDVGFMQDMADHHDQAVTMGICASENAVDPTVRNFARDVIIFQRYEIGLMEARLGERGLERIPYDPQREVMAWMDEPTTLSNMPGLATEEELDALCEAEGLEADMLFLELMTEHHLGGVHMADYAAAAAESATIRQMARTMANVQSGEIDEYRSAMERLRTEGPRGDGTAPADGAGPGAADDPPTTDGTEQEGTGQEPTEPSGAGA